MDVQDFLIQGDGSEADKREALGGLSASLEQQMKGQLEEAVALTTFTRNASDRGGLHFSRLDLQFHGEAGRGDRRMPQGNDCDPEFGNPYNDIGAYLIEKGDLDESIPGFKRPCMLDGMKAPPFPT